MVNSVRRSLVASRAAVGCNIAQPLPAVRRHDTTRRCAVRRIIFIVAVFLAAMSFFAAGPASAATRSESARATPASVQHASAPLASSATQAAGYCGPAFTSKAQMIAWLRSHPAQAYAATVYLRKNASYYHIQPDQDIISWLQMPNVKYKLAPVGYMIYYNTSCDDAGNVVKYNGRYNVSRLPMLWWCDTAAGTGTGCVPLAKYYCRNWVKGHKVFPKPPAKKPAKPAKPSKPKKKPPVTPPKTTPPGSCNVTINGTITGSVNINNCNSFTTTVTCGINTQTFSGTNAEDVAAQAQKWQQVNCAQTAPTPTAKASVTVTKLAQNASGSSIATPGGLFTFIVTCGSVNQTSLYNGPMTVSCDVGSIATATEINIPSGWMVLGPPTQSQTVSASGVNFTFTDKQLSTPPTPQPSCDSLAVSATTIQAGQSVTATTSLTANGSTLQTVLYNWGDGSTNYNGTSMSHTYSAAGTYTITATGNYNLPNGSPVSVTSAACQKQVTVSQAPPSTAPISIGKVCEDASHNQIACPTGTFTFAVSGGSVSSVTLNSNPQSAGTCTIGGSVTITENQVNGWTILSANPQTFSCTSAGINAVFKNAELATSPPAASLNFIQDIHASNYSTTPATTYTMPTCGFVQTNVGDVLSITFQAGYGNYGQPGNSTTTYNATADGTNQSFCPTYTSPTESGIQDQVMMTVLDKTTGYSVTTYSNVFNILAPGNP